VRLRLLAAPPTAVAIIGSSSAAGVGATAGNA
jgi:hypothetical protein